MKHDENIIMNEITEMVISSRTKKGLNDSLHFYHVMLSDREIL